MAVSNVGYTMNTHYCMGRAMEKSISLGVDELDCGMDMEEPTACEFTDETHFSPIPCCEDEHEVVQLHENYNTNNVDVEFNPVFWVAFTQVLYQEFFTSQITHTSYLSYSPPLPKQAVQVRFQQFLL